LVRIDNKEIFLGKSAAKKNEKKIKKIQREEGLSFLFAENFFEAKRIFLGFFFLKKYSPKIYFSFKDQQSLQNK